MVYILYSEALDRFYTGESESENVDLKLKQHNDGFFKDSFTSITDDWVLFYKIECDSRSQAKKIESHINKMKSSTYVRNIVKYPEIIERLKLKYK
ncbi:GIY-YIG nuclease family protein [Galbibacter sp. EGI 63066]|uniref:GIY-YIG nuclease family protein n=1 Tax=Galbibacter sp. EGI 63066 TaxID=2993559 RepID=UPI002249A016|nr:GIY-YIG nuclease family protein [Galbibacter sp. EGI 63066]MCX2678886.1 GIY-YIG nuclease family protein [Galbibacter sp. EGI 63066]